jgi:hypothetical protein
MSSVGLTLHWNRMPVGREQEPRVEPDGVGSQPKERIVNPRRCRAGRRMPGGGHACLRAAIPIAGSADEESCAKSSGYPERRGRCGAGNVFEGATGNRKFSGAVILCHLDVPDSGEHPPRLAAEALAPERVFAGEPRASAKTGAPSGRRAPVLKAGIGAGTRAVDTATAGCVSALRFPRTGPVHPRSLLPGTP